MMTRFALFAVVLVAFSALSFVPPPASAQLCPLPQGYANAVTFNDGDVEFTLATNKLSYAVGEQVSIHFSIGNNGTDPLVIPNPSMITPMDLMMILPGRCNTITQGNCSDYLFKNPFGVFYFGTSLTIQPGACWVREATWDGVPERGPSPTPEGTYHVFAGMWDLSDFFFPTDGVRITIKVGGSSSVPTLPSTWGRIKSLYSP